MKRSDNERVGFMAQSQNMVLVFPQTKPLYAGGPAVSLQSFCGLSLWERMCQCVEQTHLDWVGACPAAQPWEGLPHNTCMAETAGEAILKTQSLWRERVGSLLTITANMPFFMSETIVNMGKLRNETTHGTHTFVCGNTRLLTAFSVEALKKHIDGIRPSDTVDSLLTMLREKGETVDERPFVRMPEAWRILTLADWSDAQRQMYIQNNYAWLEKGVQIMDVHHTYIDSRVTIGRGTYIYPNNIIAGNTVIGENCILYAGNHILDCTIGHHVKLRAVTAQESMIHDHVTVGPFANLRPGTVLEKGVRIGDFVELKNTRVGENTRMSHLTYAGDATVGKDCNFGCGVVFVNYDGIKKHHTVVEDNAFVGCNVNLVAPVKVGKGAYVAAGTTVTEDVPPEALAIGRLRQENKADWVKKKKALQQP